MGSKAKGKRNVKDWRSMLPTADFPNLTQHTRIDVGDRVTIWIWQEQKPITVRALYVLRPSYVEGRTWATLIYRRKGALCHAYWNGAHWQKGGEE